MDGFTVPASVPLVLDPTAVDVQLITGSFLLVGWALEETTGAAGARIALRDGQSPAAPSIIPITLAAGASKVDIVTGLGLVFERGLYVDVTAGSLGGSFFVIPTQELHVDGGLITVAQGRSGYREVIDQQS